MNEKQELLLEGYALGRRDECLHTKKVIIREIKELELLAEFYEEKAQKYEEGIEDTKEDSKKSENEKSKLVMRLKELGED